MTSKMDYVLGKVKKVVRSASSARVPVQPSTTVDAPGPVLRGLSVVHRSTIVASLQANKASQGAP